MQITETKQKFFFFLLTKTIENVNSIFDLNEVLRNITIIMRIYSIFRFSFLCQILKLNFQFSHIENNKFVIISMNEKIY